MARRPAPTQDRPANGSGRVQKAVKSSGRSDDSAEDQETPVGAVSKAASAGQLLVRRALRAFELLAAQPVSLAGLPQTERDMVVVTAVADDQGREHPISRFGDAVWDLSSEIVAKNKKGSQTKVKWPEDDVPKALVDDAKAAIYCAFRRGREMERPLSASSIASIGQKGTLVLRHLGRLGVQNFGQVRALYVSDYIAKLRERLAPSTVNHRLATIDLIWSFALDVLHPLPEDPWAGKGRYKACGLTEADSGPASRTGKTPVIPRAAQRILFEYCEARLDEAEELLRARDAGELSATGREMRSLRDAVLYLLQISSGMRNSESMGATNGCWRTEVKNGVTFHWVRTREVKTTGGKEVDFLVPPEMHRALEVLQRVAQPLQARLADEARWLEGLLARGADAADKLNNGMTVAQAVKRLNHVRKIAGHLFLGLDKRVSDHLGVSRVGVMSDASCRRQLLALARAAGTDWALTNHQCRRTFAYNVANSRLGRMGLVFLKWQLKQASLGWTQCYAASPYQDHALYREMEQELVEARVDVFESWAQPDARLSGGAGRRLMQTRAQSAGDLRQLLTLTAEAVELRSTGHAWCISGTRGCHGQGVYYREMCGDCSQAIIDEGQAEQWQMIHLDNLRLASITDCGPAVTQRAGRALERSARVLKDLGVPLPSAELAKAYAMSVGEA